MPPKPWPILLDGFCHTTQRRQHFNQSWACAFHTSWYTNEDDLIWESVSDPRKTREIRYGNNIHVLFLVLLHCKHFYGNKILWQAVARGFNTSPTIVRETAEIFTEARKVQRRKSTAEASETTHAADEWIDFLDQFDLYKHTPSNSNAYEVASAFFRTQEKKHVNSARVSINGRPFFASGASSRVPSSPALKLESPREPADRHRAPPFSRKRSASPSPTERSLKSRRFDNDFRQQPKAQPERHGALDELPTIQPTRSPRHQSHPLPAQAMAPAKREEVPTGPAHPARSVQPVPGSSAPVRKEAPTGPAQPAQPAKLIISSQSNFPARKEETPNNSNQAASATPTTTPQPTLREDINGLKKDMATNTNAVSTMMESMHDLVDGFSSLQEEVSALSTQVQQAKALAASTAGDSTQYKGFVASVSASISSLTTQHNDLATSVLASVSALSTDYKDLATGVSVLATQQTDLAAIVAKFSDNNSSGGDLNIDNLLQSLQTCTTTIGTLQAEIAAIKKTQVPDTLLQSIQTLTNTVATFQTEIADLKNNQTPAAHPTATDTKNLESLLRAQNTRIDKLFQELTSLRESELKTAPAPANNLKTLLHAQNTRIDKLFQELTALRESQPPKPAPAPAPAPAPTPKPQPQVQQPQQRPRPQTLRQAMALAEQDLRQHLSTIQGLYYQGGSSRAVTESTADLMALLGDGVRAAQAGQGSG